MESFNNIGLSWELAARLGINCIAIAYLVFFLYYRRYRELELATTVSLLNLIVFILLTIASSATLSLLAGFCIFIIAALFSMKSAQNERNEVSYLFGSIAIAIICSAQGITLSLVLALTVYVLIVSWAIDRRSLLQSINSKKSTSDAAHSPVVSNPETLGKQLEHLFGAEVAKHKVTHATTANHFRTINVYYRK